MVYCLCYFLLFIFWKMILSFALIFIAALANGLGDRIKFHDPYPNSKFWSASSWTNIYKDGKKANGRAFIGSTSFLAFTCDGWHLCKFITVECIMLALVLPCNLCESLFSYFVIWFIYRFLFFIGFEITWR
jgi:hypothetical protein